MNQSQAESIALPSANNLTPTFIQPNPSQVQQQLVPGQPIPQVPGQQIQQIPGQQVIPNQPQIPTQPQVVQTLNPSNPQPYVDQSPSVVIQRVEKINK